MAANNPGWDMKLPFWGAMIALLAAIGAYYGNKEAASVSQAEIKGNIILLMSEVTGVKASVSRMEIGRYTSQDSQRDLVWRDERAMELAKRVTELEIAARRKR